MRLISFSFLSIILFASCDNNSKSTTTTLKSIDKSFMNTEVAPCMDFYEHASGIWSKNNPVPSTESKWSAFNEVIERNNKILKNILLTSGQQANEVEKGSNIQKIGTYFNLAMDTTKLDAEGVSAIKSQLELIDKIQSNNEIPVLLAQLHHMGVKGIFYFDIEQDMKINTQYISYVGQSGLGLPDKDYYFKDDENSKEIRTKYEAHINKMMELAGFNNNSAANIIAIETNLAEASMNRLERRNYEIQYNKMHVNDLVKMAPNFYWNDYFNQLNVKFDTIIVSQPKFIEKMNSMIKSVSVVDWKLYFTWHLLNATATKLSADFEQADFNFYQATLKGTKEMKPRWKRALSAVDGGMGELLGQEYVKVAFSEDAKKRLNGLVDNLLLAYEERIKNLEWMGEETKKEALKKLSTFTRKLGYPDVWKDYSNLTIENDSYVANYFRIRAFNNNKTYEKLGKPIDKTEWYMSPQTVNAYYNPVVNEIVFPAGILQPPFMDPEADDAILYGTIGAVIGHEITHGFDDSGSGFDADGNLKNWWTEDDLTNFKTRADVVVKHFEKFEPLPGVNVNGKLTLGENIADFGGLTVSYYAYQKSLEGKERTEIDGFTPEQRFFLAFGQVWKSNYTDEAMREQILTNTHTPSMYRVRGTLSLMPEFYEAFNCGEGTNMYRPDSLRVVIW
jgi:putative endopeptidase